MRTAVIVVVLAAIGGAWLLTSELPARSAVERGRYLVEACGCADCHTPWTPGPHGPQPDPARAFAGHPESLVVDEGFAPSGPWLAASSATNTAWAGPWGVSFSANLTPDAETGIGRWSARTFRDAMRNARHMGSGRPILPPMPSAAVAHLDDGDLDAMFAYLKSLPPQRNRVPDPLPPARQP